MKRLAVYLLALALGACTTLHPILEPAADVQRELAAGTLLKVGDWVEVTTNDGKRHAFSVTALTAGAIEGRGVSIPVGEVASVAKREFSVGKSLLVVAGVALALVASKGYSETHHRNCSGGTIC